MKKRKSKSVVEHMLSEAAWEREFRIKYPEKDGWIIRKKGFPDRIVFNVKTKELLLFELKAGKHEFHKFQKEMMFILMHAKKRRLFLVSYNAKGKKQKIESVNRKTLAKGWEGVEGLRYME